MPQAAGNPPVPMAPEKASVTTTTPGVSEDERAKVTKLTNWLNVPADILSVLQGAKDLRSWMTDILFKDVDDTVTSNYTLRYIQADVAKLTATKPRTSLKPRRRFYTDAGQPNLVPANIERFAKTGEVLLDFFADKGRMIDALNNACRDAKVVRAGWVKLVWNTEPGRRPTGERIRDTKVQSFMRLKYLRQLRAEGKMVAGSAEEFEQEKLEDYVRTEMIADLEAQSREAGEPSEVAVTVESPEAISVIQSTSPLRARALELIAGAKVSDDELADPPVYAGFDFDVIDLEDMRMDWFIDRPEYYHKSRRMGHRSRMTVDQVVANFNLTKEKAESIAKVSGEENWSSTTTTDKHVDAGNPTSSSTGQATNYGANLVDVWEIWDIEDMQVYVIAEGCDFLLNQFTPRNVGPQWFPFFYLWFNEIPGQIYAPSDLELLMSLQDEMNSIRTHAREYRKASLPRLLIAKGAMTPKEIERFENSNPFEVIELERPDKVKDSFEPFAGVTYNPALVSTAEVLLDMQVIGGLPVSGLGGVGGSKLATEVAFAREQLGSQEERKAFLFKQFTNRIFTEMYSIILRSLPPENAIAIAGPGAVFPLDPNEREAMAAELFVEVNSSPMGKPDVQKEVENLNTISAIMQQHGHQMNPVWLASRLNEIFDRNTDFQSAISAVVEPPGGPRPARPSEPPPTGQPTGPAPGTPNGGLPATPTVNQLPGAAPG